MSAQTIDEVIARLDDLIKRARAEASRLGFFATLYRNVTLKVKEGIGSAGFDDGPRMERLDVTLRIAISPRWKIFAEGQLPVAAGESPFRLRPTGRH